MKEIQNRRKVTKKQQKTMNNRKHKILKLAKKDEAYTEIKILPESVLEAEYMREGLDGGCWG